MKRVLAIAAGGLLIGGVVLVLFPTYLPARGPAPSPSASPGAPSPEPASAPRYTVSPQPVSTQADAELTAAIDAFLGAVPVSPVASDAPTAADAWARCRERGESPLDFARELDRAIRAHGPAGAGRLLTRGMEGADERYLFVAAKTLSQRLDRPTALQLLGDLPDAPEAVRPHTVFALRGSVDPEVDQAFVDLYEADADPRVQARAGSNLADRLERLDPPLKARALNRARQQLGAEDMEQVEAAADVLGGAPLEPRDRSQLEAVVTTGTDPQRRMAALRALATSGLSPADLQEVLVRVRDDASAGEQLRGLARQLLGQQ